MLRTLLATAVLSTGAMIGAASEAQAQRLVPCARENGYCRVPYPTRVIYGVPGRRAEIFVRGDGVPCTNRVFGDPAPGVVKRCSYVARNYDRGYRDRGYRDYGYDDDFRRPRRGDPRDYRDYDDGYGWPFRGYDPY